MTFRYLAYSQSDFQNVLILTWYYIITGQVPWNYHDRQLTLSLFNCFGCRRCVFICVFLPCSTTASGQPAVHGSGAEYQPDVPHPVPCGVWSVSVGGLGAVYLRKLQWSNCQERYSFMHTHSCYCFINYKSHRDLHNQCLLFKNNILFGLFRLLNHIFHSNIFKFS